MYKKRKKEIWGVLLLLLFWGTGCDNIETPEKFDDSSTWKSISTRILEPKCATCHVEGSSFATQSGLLLTREVAYEELVSTEVKNSAAQADGLEMLGTKGLESLSKSFLWEKINVYDESHFYTDHPYYGAQMPLGGDPLTDGELDLIKAWILAGAPKEGIVADLSLLENANLYQRPAFTPLEPPTSGLQLHLGPLEIAPNYERELLYYEPLNQTEDLFINRVEISMRSGSHHFILYRFDKDIPQNLMPAPKVVRDLRDANGSYNINNLFPMQYHEFFSGTQWPWLNYNFPPGVAIRMPAGEGLDLNAHYVNTTNQPITGEVFINLHTIKPSEVQREAKILNWSNFNISLPPKKVTTLEKTFTTNKRMNIFQLFSHAHKYMVEFRVEIVGGARNGELVYITNDWEHPPILELDPPLVLNPGEGLKLKATYNNTTERTLGFGLLSEDEMMILFGAYY